MTQFLKLHQLPNIWESFVTIGRGTYEKKEEAATVRAAIN